MKRSLLATALTAILLTSCASIIQDAEVAINIETPDNKKGNCEFSNKHGKWNSEVPNIITVRRSFSPLDYVCNIENTEYKGNIKEQSNLTVAGNIIFGGIIGIGVDAANDMGNYPDAFLIVDGVEAE